MCRLSIPIANSGKMRKLSGEINSDEMDESPDETNKAMRESMPQIYGLKQRSNFAVL